MKNPVITITNRRSMSKRVTLADEEVEFILEFCVIQKGHAQSDPNRGVLTVAALDRLIDKLQVKDEA